MLFPKITRHDSGEWKMANKTHVQLQVNRTDAVDLSVMRDVRLLRQQ